jgi:zinc protease
VIFPKDMEVPMAVVVYMESADGEYNLRNDLTMDIAGQILDIIYTEEIREKEGGTYGVSTSGGYNYSYVPETQSYLQIVYQTSPEDYTRLNKRIEELLAEFAQNGPSEANLTKVKDYLHKKYQENLRENAFYNAVLTGYLRYGVDQLTDYEKVLDSITAQDVAKAIRDLLAKDNQTLVIMYGETK